MKELKTKLLNWFYTMTWELDKLIGIPYDKIRHYFAGLAIDLSSFLVMLIALVFVSLFGELSWSAALVLIHIVSFGIVVFAALAKESKDKFEGREFDSLDIFATICGGLTSKIIITAFIILIKILTS